MVINNTLVILKNTTLYFMIIYQLIIGQIKQSLAYLEIKTMIYLSLQSRD